MLPSQSGGRLAEPWPWSDVLISSGEEWACQCPALCLHNFSWFSCICCHCRGRTLFLWQGYRWHAFAHVFCIDAFLCFYSSTVCFIALLFFSHVPWSISILALSGLVNNNIYSNCNKTTESNLLRVEDTEELLGDIYLFIYFKYSLQCTEFKVEVFW